MDKQHGPWTIKKRVQKYKGLKVNLYEDQVIRPDGKESVYTTIKMADGVSVLPLDDDGFVYLVREFKYVLGRDDVATVTGGIDSNESPLAAAKRELQEEVGIEAKKWIKLGVTYPFTGIVESAAYLFLARDLSFGKSNPDGTEVIECLRVRFEEAVNMALKSEIIHSQSCVLILKANEYLRAHNEL